MRLDVFARRLAQLAMLLATLFVAGLAAAAGTVKWKSTSLDERENKSWQLEIEIYLAKAPDVPHIPVKFDFEPIAYYARDMEDGDKLHEYTKPITGQQSLIESVDMGFLDPGSGKIEKRTRFSFKVTRALGFEAGEYRVKILDGRNGSQIGAATTIKLQGKNEIIDRRAIVFSGDKKKKDKDMTKVGDGGTGDKKKDDSYDPNGSDAPPPSHAEDPNADEGEGVEEEEVKKKPGGCGCRVSESRSADWALLGLLASGLVLAARRRV
jgi:hypothetical protein